LSANTSPRAAWPWWRAGCRSAIGRTRTAASAEIVADNVYFGDSKRDGAGDFGGAPASYSAPMGGRNAAPMGGQSDFAEIGEEDGELPF